MAPVQQCAHLETGSGAGYGYEEDDCEKLAELREAKACMQTQK